MPDPQAQSRVIRFHETGGPEVLCIEQALPQAPGAGEVLLQVEAIGLNRAEAAFRAGQYLEQPAFPARLGYEASGRVLAVGDGVSGFAPDDAVCVLPGFSMNRYGVYGDWALVPANMLIRRPRGMSAQTGAAVWMAYLTAYGAIVGLADVGEGDAVVITAASSSVGIAAIQICRMLGAIPIALTRDPKKADALRAQGAVHVVVGSAAKAIDAVAKATAGRGARLVFDPVAGPSVLQLAEMTAPGGLLVLYGNLSGQAAETPFPFFAAVGKGIAVRGYLVFELIRDAARLDEAVRFIAEGLADGRLKPVIAKTFGLDEIVEAHRYLESNQQIGKILVTTGSEPSEA
jgi:NADPH:quinone reductase-like Zn-dependent oxidoreductase